MDEQEVDYDQVWELEQENRQLREQISDLKATIQRLSADLAAAEKWARDYETAHGPFQREPHMPDFMVVF